MSAPRTYYLVPTSTAHVQSRVMPISRAAPVQRIQPVVQHRPVQPTSSHCLKRSAQEPVEPLDDDPLEVLLNGGPGQGPPRKRERLNHLSAEEKLDRRKLKNRVAAQTARDRKKARSQRLEEVVRQLMDENARLREENSRLRQKESKQHKEAAVESAAFISGPLPRVQVASLVLLPLLLLLNSTSCRKTRSIVSSKISRMTSTWTSLPASCRSISKKRRPTSLYKHPLARRLKEWQVP